MLCPCLEGGLRQASGRSGSNSSILMLQTREFATLCRCHGASTAHSHCATGISRMRWHLSLFIRIADIRLTNDVPLPRTWEEDVLHKDRSMSHQRKLITGTYLSALAMEPDTVSSISPFTSIRPTARVLRQCASPGTYFLARSIEFFHGEQGPQRRRWDWQIEH